MSTCVTRIFPVLLVALLALPATAQDIEVFRAESVKPVQSESVQPISSRATRYQGTARNGNYTGEARIDLSITDESTGSIQIHAYFYNGLAGDATLSGTRDRNGALRAKGELALGFERYEMVLQGTLNERGEMTASYTLTPVQGNGQVQRGTLVARSVGSAEAQPASAEKPASGPFGTWGLGVDGVAYDMDLGNVTIRTLSSGVSGLHRLTINPDGTYLWDKTRGKWRSTGDAGYPIELIQPYEGKDWRVGRDTRTTAKPGGIIVWDGSTWFTGYPAR